MAFGSEGAKEIPAGRKVGKVPRRSLQGYLLREVLAVFPMNLTSQTRERVSADEIWSLVADSEAGPFRCSSLVVHGVPKEWDRPVARHLAHEAASRLGLRICRYWFGKQFVRAFRDAVQTKRVDEFRGFHRGQIVFAVDGLEALRESPAAQEEITLTMDALEAAGGLCVFSTSWPVARWSEFRPRLRSRLMAGLVLPFASLDLSGRGGSSTPAGIRMGVETDLGSADGTVRPSLEEIAQRTARLWGIRIGELRGPRRFRAAVTARQVAMYVSRSIFGYSLEQIGRYFGGRDHTTVAHACNRVAQGLGHDPQLQSAVTYLCQLLGAEPSWERRS